MAAPHFDVGGYLRLHGISSAEQRSGINEKLLARLPRPPDGTAFYELPDAGRKSVSGLRFRKGRKTGVSILLAAKRRAGERWESVQITIGRWTPDGSGLALSKARGEAAVIRKKIQDGVDPRPSANEAPEPKAIEQAVTLRVAYELYRDARTGRKRKPLSPATQVEYKRLILTSLAEFVDTPLSEIGDDPRPLIRHFNAVSERTPFEANTQMRVMRAVWNRAHKMLPTKVPPAPAIWDQNETQPRNAAYVTIETPALWRSIAALPRAIDRKAALTLLFLGLREGAALNIKWEHIDRDAGTLLVPWTKGKRLSLPLSQAAQSLLLTRLPDYRFAPDNPYIFPSLRGARPRNGSTGEPAPKGWRHIDKIDLSSVPPPAAYVDQKGHQARAHPHVFRHTYRTLATSAGASEIAIRLLMGHSLQGDVSFDYLTADLEWLRAAQETISSYILKAANLPPDHRFAIDCFDAQIAATD